MKIRLQHCVVLLVVSITGLLLHRGHFSEEPSGIHTWTQSDHYALARGFQENGLNFFRPETFVYHENKGKSPSTVTAVDFPIHNYVPAVVMKASGSESPAIYRWYLFLVSIIGLFYLYKLAYLFSRSIALSVMIVIFAATSPVFTYYQIRFIPSVPSLSTAIIGCYFYFLYRENKRLKTLVLALVWLTLSALTRMTFLIPLLAVCGQELFFVLKKQDERWKKLGLLLGSLIVFFSYTLYNSYLRSKFGGIFLTTFMPANSWKELVETTRGVLKVWKWEYLTKVHYLLIAIGLVVAAYRVFVRKTANGALRENSLLVIFLISGAIVFYILMIGQFPAHDYYFIDSFLLPLMIVLILSLGWIVPEKKVAKMALWLIATGCFALLFKLDYATQEARHKQELYGQNAQVISNFKQSDQLLDKLGIGANEIIVVLDPSPCNVPLLALNRKGYVNMQNNRKSIAKAMALPADYYVFQNVLFPQSIFKFYPEIIGELEVMGSNGKITVCRKKKSGNKSLMAFLKLDQQKPVFQAISGDSNQKWSWETGKWDSIQRFFISDPSDEFDPSIKIKDTHFFRNGRMIILDGELAFPKNQDLEWIFSFTENGELLKYETYSLQYTLTGRGEWKKFLLFLQAPACKREGEMAAYLWNTKHLKYHYRNLRCRIY